MSSSLNGLVPTRFLCLTAHLVMTIMIFWVREYNVRASLGGGYSQEQYTAKDTELIIGLSVALGLFLIEFIGFFGGISMFMHSQGLISMASHVGGCAGLMYIIWDHLGVGEIWLVIGASNGIPAFLDLIIMINKLAIRKV